MISRFRRTAVVTAALAAGLALAPPAAQAARDTRAPTISVPARAGFVVGSAIDPMALDAFGDPSETTGIRMTAKIKASDASGICGYRSRVVTSGGPPSAWSAWTGSPTLTVTSDDYEDQFGGGSLNTDGYDVQVKDCKGNKAVRHVRTRPHVFQEDGSSFFYSGVTTARSGSWATTNCACWSGGKAWKSTTSGSEARFVVSGDAAQPVALVMEKAPDRGKVRILVDGVAKATVDTYAATKKHRSIVWAGQVPAGEHTVTVVNLATPNRPRVDVDAFIVNS
jgi:hypothetical protein